MVKTVLLTNFQMKDYSGSELDTLNIANYFLDNNYEVTIFTLKYGYPLLGEIDSRIKLVTSSNIGDMRKKYDIIWAHHYPLLDYLLFFQGISADYIHYVSLSAVMDFESLPDYYKDLNLVSVMSSHTKDALRDEMYDVNNFELFTNYTSKSNFDFKIKDRNLNKICVISNHVPDEILEFAKIYESKKGKVDIYGRRHKYVKVTPELLSKYSLVITIGRTVNDALAVGIPVYCYDRFGGEGFLTKDNVSDSYYYAFSGKFSYKKRTALEIYEDIVNNYSNAKKDVRALRKFAYDNFCFEKMMKKTTSKMKTTEKFDLDKVIKKYPFMKRKGPIFYNRLNEEIIKSNIYKGQIYFDQGAGFSEENSISKYYKFENGKHIFEVRVPKDTVKIRFDFSNLKYSKINDIYINGKKVNLKFLNCLKLKDSSYISLNDDPGFIFKNNGYLKLKIVCNIDILSSDDLLKEMYKSKNLFRKLKDLNEPKHFVLGRKG